GAVSGLCVCSYIAARIAERRMRESPLAGSARRILRAVHEMLRRPGILTLGLAISFAIQLAFIGLSIGLAEAIGLHLPVEAWLFAWPLAKLIAVAPISFGGIGVREASLAGLLTPFGADPALVVAASLLWQSIFFAGSLGGGLAALAAARYGVAEPKDGQTDASQP
ncbi:MAG: lysylphosphatidylglycerol synthase transmembrane domain-containing protein, partial [Pseudomonadota bacterium]